MNEKALLELLEAIIESMNKLQNNNSYFRTIGLPWEVRDELMSKLDKLKGLSDV